MVENWGTRNIPQVLRHYLIVNNLRTTSMSGLMDYCNNFPLLLKIKRMMLHDIATTKKEIKFYKKQLREGKFRFRYVYPGTKGYRYDPSQIWDEDLANTRYDVKELIVALVELDHWLDKQEPYLYPAEKYIADGN